MWGLSVLTTSDRRESFAHIYAYYQNEGQVLKWITFFKQYFINELNESEKSHMKAWDSHVMFGWNYHVVVGWIYERISEGTYYKI